YPFLCSRFVPFCPVLSLRVPLRPVLSRSHYIIGGREGTGTGRTGKGKTKCGTDYGIQSQPSAKDKCCPPTRALMDAFALSVCLPGSQGMRLRTRSTAKSNSMHG